MDFAASVLLEPRYQNPYHCAAIGLPISAGTRFVKQHLRGPAIKFAEPYLYTSRHGIHSLQLIWGQVSSLPPSPESRHQEFVVSHPDVEGLGEAPKSAVLSQVGVIVRIQTKPSGRYREITSLAKEPSSTHFIGGTGANLVPGFLRYFIAALTLLLVIGFSTGWLPGIITAIAVSAFGFALTYQKTQYIIEEAKRTASAVYRATRSMQSKTTPQAPQPYEVIEEAMSEE